MHHTTPQVRVHVIRKVDGIGGSVVGIKVEIGGMGMNESTSCGMSSWLWDNQAGMSGLSSFNKLLYSHQAHVPQPSSSFMRCKAQAVLQGAILRGGGYLFWPRLQVHIMGPRHLLPSTGHSSLQQDDHRGRNIIQW